MTKKDTPEAQAPILAYKGFDMGLKCRNFQYEIGNIYTHDGKVEACSSGFHACENPLDVLSYYGPVDARFCLVEMSGEIARHSGDSKVASAKIKVKAEIGLPQIITDGVKWLMALCKDVATDATAASGDSSQLAASGHSSHLAASGHYSQLAASGHSSKLAASGENSIACAAAPNCTASAGENGCIVLTRWVEAEKRFRVSVSYVGEGGIKADVLYKADENGKLVEVQS